MGLSASGGSVRKKIEEQPWWPKLVKKKDTKSLRELGDEFGVSAAAISNALKRNKLTRKPARSGPRGTKGTAGATSAASAKKAAPRKTTPKKTAARRVARSKTPTVKAARPGGLKRGRRSVLAKYQDQMGKVVDREIAEKAGVTVSAVTNYRKRHNIPPATGRGRPRRSPLAPAVRTSTRRRTGAMAFQVAIGSETLVVVAKDIVAAAQRATAAGRGEVTRIELIGAAIT